MDLPSRLDLYNLGRANVMSRASKIDPAQIDVQGSDINLFVGTASVIGSAIISQLAYSISRLFEDGAKENADDQDRLAWDRYQLPRKGASAAIVPVTFYRTTTTGGSGVIPSGTVLITLNNFQYATLTDATFSSSAKAVTVNAQAVQAGKESQVGTNYITKIRDTVFDTTIGVVNTVPSAGGEPAEDNDAFDLRIRNFWNSARRGTLSAIESGALTVPGIASANAVELTDSEGNPSGTVLLYFADSSGVANVAQLPALKTALNDWRAAGIVVQFVPGIPQIVSVVLHLTFQASADADSIANQIRRAVVEYVNSLPINATLTRAAIFSLLHRYTDDGLIVNDKSISAPIGDFVPAYGQTLRTRLENVVIS